MTTTNQYNLRLISHKLCPYVQRAVIALEEQGINYERIDIDLAKPPEWFLRLSPLGKVPVLVVDDTTVLFESAVIAEYVNDIGGAELLAKGHLAKAQQRAWIEFASATLDNIGALYSASGEKSYARVASELDSKWRQLEQILTEAPFFSGQQFSLVDAAFAPVFRYLDIFEQLVESNFLDNYARLSKWHETLGKRGSVIKAVRPEYPTLLAEFLAQRDSYLGKRAKTFLANRIAA